MKKKVFNIIQIGDKSNRLSRLFDIFIAIVICANILVTFLQTFDELAFFISSISRDRGYHYSDLLCGIYSADLDCGLSIS